MDVFRDLVVGLGPGPRLCGIDVLGILAAVVGVLVVGLRSGIRIAVEERRLLHEPGAGSSPAGEAAV